MLSSQVAKLQGWLRGLWQRSHRSTENKLLLADDYPEIRKVTPPPSSGLFPLATADLPIDRRDIGGDVWGLPTTRGESPDGFLAPPERHWNSPKSRQVLPTSLKGSPTARRGNEVWPYTARVSGEPTPLRVIGEPRQLSGEPLRLPGVSLRLTGAFLQLQGASLQLQGAPLQLPGASLRLSGAFLQLPGEFLRGVGVTLAVGVSHLCRDWDILNVTGPIALAYPSSKGNSPWLCERMTPQCPRKCAAFGLTIGTAFSPVKSISPSRQPRAPPATGVSVPLSIMSHASFLQNSQQTPFSSFPRMRESSLLGSYRQTWIPVFTGMTTFARASCYYI